MWDGPRVSSPFHWTHHSKVPIVGSGRTKISAFLATPGHVEKELSCTRPLGSKRRKVFVIRTGSNQAPKPTDNKSKRIGQGGACESSLTITSGSTPLDASSPSHPKTASSGRCSESSFQCRRSSQNQSCRGPTREPAKEGGPTPSAKAMGLQFRLPAELHKASPRKCPYQEQIGKCSIRAQTD